MANPEHIQRLLEGVETWNRYRQGDGFTPDLSEVNLYEKFRSVSKLDYGGRIPLAGADLRRAKLEKADLNGANLSHANLAGANLENAKLVDTYLNFAQFDNANLSFADLTNADLEHATLAGTKLGTAILTGANFNGAKPWQAFLYPKEELELSPAQGQLSDSRIERVGDLLDTIGKVQGCTKGLRFTFVESQDVAGRCVLP